MKKIMIAIALLSTTAFANAASEQVWNASLTNSQITCGIDYTGGTPVEGGILTANESGTNTSKAISFTLIANTQNVNWQITEAKLVQNTGRFDFSDNLLSVNDKTKTSVYINDQEYAWPDAAQAKALASNSRVIKLAPKINLEQSAYPLGTTRIQGKIVINCIQ